MALASWCPGHHRSAGTVTLTWLTCWPQPAQVVLTRTAPPSIWMCNRNRTTAALAMTVWRRSTSGGHQSPLAARSALADRRRPRSRSRSRRLCWYLMAIDGVECPSRYMSSAMLAPSSPAIDAPVCRRSCKSRSCRPARRRASRQPKGSRVALGREEKTVLPRRGVLKEMLTHRGRHEAWDGHGADPCVGLGRPDVNSCAGARRRFGGARTHDGSAHVDPPERLASLVASDDHVSTPQLAQLPRTEGTPGG